MNPIHQFSFHTLCLLVFLFFPGLGICENPSKTTGYRLGSGDILSISIVAGAEEQAKADLVVSDHGEVNVPFIGKVQAAGMSLANLEKNILVSLERDYFVNPQIHLLMVEYHSLSFFISGAVKQPALYELDFYPTVMDLIAKAGGVLQERGNIAYILPGKKDINVNQEVIEQEISKKNPKIVDLIKLLDEGDMTGNIVLKTGDTVYIPLSTKLNQSRTKIYVEGELKNPGVFEYQPGLTVLAACIMAGGFDKYAAPSRTRVIRNKANGQVILKINLEKVISGDLADELLLPGDRIHVPETWL